MLPKISYKTSPNSLQNYYKWGLSYSLYQTTSPNYKWGLYLYYSPTNERSPNYKWGLSFYCPTNQFQWIKCADQIYSFNCASPTPLLHHHYFLPISLPPFNFQNFPMRYGPLSSSHSFSVPPTCQMKKGLP